VKVKVGALILSLSLPSPLSWASSVDIHDVKGQIKSADLRVKLRSGGDKSILVEPLFLIKSEVPSTAPVGVESLPIEAQVILQTGVADDKLKMDCLRLQADSLKAHFPQIRPILQKFGIQRIVLATMPIELSILLAPAVTINNEFYGCQLFGKRTSICDSHQIHSADYIWTLYLPVIAVPKAVAPQNCQIVGAPEIVAALEKLLAHAKLTEDTRQQIRDSLEALGASSKKH